MICKSLVSLDKWDSLLKDLACLRPYFSCFCSPKKRWARSFLFNSFINRSFLTQFVQINFALGCSYTKRAVIYYNVVRKKKLVQICLAFSKVCYLSSNKQIDNLRVHLRKKRSFRRKTFCFQVHSNEQLLNRLLTVWLIH